MRGVEAGPSGLPVAKNTSYEERKKKTIVSGTASFYTDHAKGERCRRGGYRSVLVDVGADGDLKHT